MGQLVGGPPGLILPGVSGGHHAILGHRAGEQAALNGGVGVEGHTILLADGEDILFHPAGQNGVLALDDVNFTATGHVGFDVLGIHVGGADAADLARLLQIHQGADRILHRILLQPRRVADRVVGVVDVDVVGAQALQAVFAVLDNVLVAVGHIHLVAVHLVPEAALAGIPVKGGLGGDHILVPLAGDGLAHHFLAVAQAVNGGGVDGVDPQVIGPVDGVDRDLVVRSAPPGTAADGHGAEGNGRGVNIGMTDLHVLHMPLPQPFFSAALASARSTPSTPQASSSWYLKITMTFRGPL